MEEQTDQTCNTKECLLRLHCVARSCGQPPDPANGWHSGECYTYGCKINYNCGTGYELVGKQERTCQSDGSWAPKELPTCVCKYSPPLTPSTHYRPLQILRLTSGDWTLDSGHKTLLKVFKQ